MDAGDPIWPPVDFAQLIPPLLIRREIKEYYLPNYVPPPAVPPKPRFEFVVPNTVLRFN